MPDEPKKKHGKKRVKSPGSVNWQNKKLSAITTRDIKNLRTSLSKNSGDAAANHALKLVRVVYNKAVEWGEFKGVNPALNPGILKIQSRDRFLQKDELPRLFTALAETENINVRDFILLAILTGARKANVLAMQWREVDLIRREWRIPDTKNGEPVIVQLPLEAVEILSARQAPGATWVFPSKSASGHMTSPKNSVSVILKRAGIENLTIHDLRRTLGSWQAIMGASLAIIGKSLGHKSVAATQIYARLSADPVRESVTRATAAMMEAGGLTQGAGVLNFKKTDRLDSKLTESKPGGNSTSGPSGKRVVRFTFRDGSTSDIDLTEHQEICARQRAELAEDEEKARYILAEAARARRRAKSDAAKAKAQEDRASKDLDSRDAKICSHAKVEKNKQVHGYLERTGRAFDMTAENVKKILDKADNREN
jgi:integrase